MKNMNKKGFTLVELIVVIVIIAILAAIAIPAMLRYINNANDATAEANCRAVVSAAVAAKAGANAFTTTGATFNTELEALLGVTLAAGATTGPDADGVYTTTARYGNGDVEILHTAETVTDVEWKGRGRTATWASTSAGNAQITIDRD